MCGLIMMMILFEGLGSAVLDWIGFAWCSWLLGYISDFIAGTAAGTGL